MKNYLLLVLTLTIISFISTNLIYAQGDLNKIEIRGKKLYFKGAKANDNEVESLILQQNNSDVISKFNEYKKDRNTAKTVSYVGLGLTAIGSYKLLTMKTDKFGFIDTQKLKNNALIGLGGIVIEIIGLTMHNSARKNKLIPGVEMYNRELNNGNSELGYEIVPTFGGDGIGVNIKF